MRQYTMDEIMWEPDKEKGDICPVCGRITNTEGVFADGTYVSHEGACMHCWPECPKCEDWNMKYVDVDTTKCTKCGHTIKITDKMRKGFRE